MKPANLKEVEPQKNNVNKILAEVRLKKPTEVVIWYQIPGECGIRTSSFVDRTKTVGALTCAAMDVWNS